MPDEGSAADEHALLAEITAPLFSLPHDPVTAAANPEFPIVLRGYDREAVEQYVRRTSQLVAELQATRSPEAAVRRALERVGEQTSGILQRAHDTAAQITSQSRSEAEDRLEVARAEAQQIISAAEQRVRDLDADADRIWGERQRIVDDARQLAQELLTLADAAGQRFPGTEEEDAVSAAAEPEGETGPVQAASVASGLVPDETSRTGAYEPFDPDAHEPFAPGAHEPLADAHEPFGANRIEAQGVPSLDPPAAAAVDPEATAQFDSQAIASFDPATTAPFDPETTAPFEPLRDERMGREPGRQRPDSPGGSQPRPD